MPYIHYKVESRMSIIRFYTTSPSELVKKKKNALWKLKLKLVKIAGKRFDSAINMNDIYRDLATRMTDCSSFATIVHCYGHLLNLAAQ